MQKPWLVAAVAGALAVVFGAVPATARVSAGDRTFVRNAAQAGLAEVAEARVALQRAVDADARDFAQRMIDDHTAANQRLARIAAREGIPLPSQPNAQQRAQLARLRSTSGARFDQAYIDDQVAAHRTAVRLFRNESNYGADPALRQFAGATLPTLRDHQRMSIAVAENVRASRSGRFAHRRIPMMRHM